MRRAQAAQGPDGEHLNSGFEQLAGLLSGRSGIKDLNLHYSWIPSLGRNIGKSNALFPDQRVSTYPREMHSVSQAELRSEGRWFVRTYHHYQDWEADVERVGQRRNITRYRAHTVGGLFQASTAQLGGDGSVGLEWLGRRGVVIDDEEFSSDGAPLPTQELVDGEEDTLGAFFDHRWRFSGVAVSAGLRYDHIVQSANGREDRDGQWSGSAGLEYAVGEAWTLRTELATGYRFPGLSERYFSGSTPRGEVLGNPALQPESRRNVELALEYHPSVSALRSSFSVYYSDLDDYIERYPVNPRLVSYRNLESASIRGVEFDLSYRSGPLDHRLSYQWQEGEDADGNTLADLNPPGWRYFLSWEGRRRSFFSDLSHRASRDEFGADEVPLNAAWIWNARFSQRVSNAWRAELYLSNILDETYRATADAIAPLQPGRTVGIRFEWRKG
jgi:iron complex outermembrane receptor protein